MARRSSTSSPFSPVSRTSRPWQLGARPERQPSITARWSSWRRAGSVITSISTILPSLSPKVTTPDSRPPGAITTPTPPFTRASASGADGPRCAPASARADEPLRGMAALGYPAYFVTILGAWKLLGGLALLAPRLPRLKEWAYAGIAFDLTGAAFSHAAVGHPAAKVIAPLVILGLAAASWALRPASRRLGSVPDEIISARTR